MYQAVISSNSSHDRIHSVRLPSEARWTPEDGGKYYRCAV